MVLTSIIWEYSALIKKNASRTHVLSIWICQILVISSEIDHAKSVSAESFT